MAIATYDPPKDPKDPRDTRDTKDAKDPAREHGTRHPRHDDHGTHDDPTDRHARPPRGRGAPSGREDRADAGGTAEGGTEPPLEGGAPTPPLSVPTSLSVTTQFAQFYRLEPEENEVSLEIVGLAPPVTDVSWVLVNSLDEQFQDHTETTTTDEAGNWTHIVNVHGPMDVVRVRFTCGSETVVSAPFDIIGPDAEAPATRSDEDLELRLERHASFTEGGLARPSSPPMPFQVLPLEREIDIRVRMAREFAQRATTNGSVIDAGKALLLLIDCHVTTDPTQSKIGQDALAGKVPSLLV